MIDAPGPWIELPVRPSELFDRLTIDRLKAERLALPEARARAAARRDWMHAKLEALAPWPASVQALLDELQTVNATLWGLEARQRAHLRAAAEAAVPPEARHAFAQAAAQIYQLNDRRAALKNALDLRFGAAPGDDKSHAHSAQPPGPDEET